MTIEEASSTDEDYEMQLKALEKYNEVALR